MAHLENDRPKKNSMMKISDQKMAENIRAWKWWTWKMTDQTGGGMKNDRPISCVLAVYGSIGLMGYIGPLTLALILVR